MIVIGAENLAERLEIEPFRQHKAILNEMGIVIFAASIQHSTVKVPGISYADDYHGNALAVIFDAKKFEIRWHRDFSKERVKQLGKHSELTAFKEHLVIYQGNAL